MAQGSQDKLTRVRPPRIHVAMDVETGDAIQMTELPFVVGVMGDFAGQPSEAPPLLRDRKFIDVNPDNFDEVLKGMTPRIVGSVDNRLQKDDPDAGKLSFELKFESIEDFEPQRVAQQVPALKALLDLRTKLNDLKGTLQGNPNFEDLLDSAIRNEATRGQLANELRQSKEEKK